MTMALFTHPASVCMTYSTHMWLSLRICYHFAVGSVTSFVHAFLPDICVTSASDTTRHIAHLLATAGCR